MSNMEKKEKELLGPQIEDALMRYILQEPISAGQKIPNEFELAKRFGVGRSTIREAVKGLVTRGILEVRRGSGTYVISTTGPAEDPLGLGQLTDRYRLIRELFEVRLMLEPEMAALACVHASKDEIRHLMQLCRETEELYNRGLNHVNKDIEFHTYIASCSRNRVVEQLLPVISASITAFASETHRMLKEETLSTHRAIANAISRRDAVGARCAMIMHLTYNRQMVMKIWDNCSAQAESTD